METDISQIILKDFLTSSSTTIRKMTKQINLMIWKKNFSDITQKAKLNEMIVKMTYERDKRQGYLDCVTLEMLSLVLDEQFFVNSNLLRKRGYVSVSDFVKGEKLIIEKRGLYKKFPYSITDVLKKGLADKTVGYLDDVRVSYSDVKKSIDDQKVVKTLIKTL